MGHTSHRMRGAALGVAAIVALWTGPVTGHAVAMPTQHLAGGAGHSYNPASHRHTPNFAWQMLRATNATRAAHGLHRLRLDRVIAPLTQGHTRVMADQHRLFHTPNVGRYLSHVPRWHRWGENIGWTSGTVDDLEAAFMSSPEHRCHVLSKSFRHVAVGAVSHGQKIWVTLFFYG